MTSRPPRHRPLVLAFDGPSLPDGTRALLAEGPAAGITLFRFRNVFAADQLAALTGAVHAAADDGAPFLVCADQEGGQFLALGDLTTPFPGSMALGAAGDEDLAERVGRATGLELRALGVTVAYAPDCDVATNPANPGCGIRSFGDDPAAVGRFAAATIRGLQAAGVAATVKHFPGAGDLALDTHHELAGVAHDRERLERVELVPFRAAIAAGARLAMSGHFAVPALTGRDDLPSTLARRVMRDLLRDELGFGGVSITDALDMKALGQGEAQAVDVIAALAAGVDLLLCAPDPEAEARIGRAVERALSRELLDPAQIAASAARVEALRRWLAGFAVPSFDVVRSADHEALAREVAARSITLVRDDAGLLPLRLPPDARVAAIMPAPRDLTPADTSSAVPPGLAAALGTRLPGVEGFVTSHPPTDGEIAALRARAADFDLLVVGTLAASSDPAQAALVEALLATRVPTITVALRAPFDLAAYAAAPTHVCTYGILAPSLDALVDALVGRSGFTGRLPAAIPGLYPTGHGVVLPPRAAATVA